MGEVGKKIRFRHYKGWVKGYHQLEFIIGSIVRVIGAPIVIVAMIVMYGTEGYKMYRSASKFNLPDDQWRVWSQRERGKKITDKVRDMWKGKETAVYKKMYFTASDGCRIAMDIWMPKDTLTKKRRLSCVLNQSRYYRAFRLYEPCATLFAGGKPFLPQKGPFKDEFIKANMIYVTYDIRGSGASYG